ncbi:MAG: hypothetical protein HGA38_03690 [Candidatus Moranbacteria bacterium]|nr:hypothetical protein [Candidatus Moranbacteria bacterium]NTW45808.1 hypothetical protein [Candidatus Moranbacteria bacterium]
MFFFLSAFFAALTITAFLLWMHGIGLPLFHRPLVQYAGVCFVFALAGYVVLPESSRTISVPQVLTGLVILFTANMAFGLIACAISGVYSFTDWRGAMTAHSVLLALAFLILLSITRAVYGIRGNIS